MGKGAGTCASPWPQLGCLWLMNIILLAASMGVIYFWSSIEWIVGKSATSVLLQVFAILLLVYSLVCGMLVLGCPGLVKMSGNFYQQGGGCYWLVSIILPLLVICFFGGLSYLTWQQDGPYVNDYLAEHVRQVFVTADTQDPVDLLNYYEFSQYTFSLSDYEDLRNSSEFRAQLITVFDALDHNNDGFLDEESYYDAILAYLLPTRRNFAICATVVVAVIIIYMAFFRFCLVRLTPKQIVSFNEAPTGSTDSSDDSYGSSDGTDGDDTSSGDSDSEEDDESSYSGADSDSGLDDV